MRIGLLHCPLFVWFICGLMWCRRVLSATLPAPLSTTLSPGLWVYLCKWGPQGLLVLGLPVPFVPHSVSLSPATATRGLSTPVPVFAPPTSLDVFIFYFLCVSPPCCSILCQFWLCEEAQCVYLRRHLGSPSS